ncbi:unnamed protein product [Euphydryas editha]|uniref:Uncharacterized protein n=1 Tax=Euphydryas editha TaxID=104508 RepID=A0AAU9V5G3_EUPED|nr:unnamed protein product [Euphydryas editha]
MIQNTRKAPNLKSNIFDKMLSNEMFSIKQHLFEKDVISSVYMSFKNNVATPTLEINQRWPIEKVIHKANVKPKFDNISIDKPTNNGEHYKNLIKLENKKNEQRNNHLNMQIETSKKVIEVRSFSVLPNNNLPSLSNMQQDKRQCTCVRHNQHKICNHHDTGVSNTEKLCTHTENDLKLVPECTRTSDIYSVSLTYFPYYAYPYFVGITTDSLNTYYHPDVVNDLKLPYSKKYKKIKKPYIYEDFSKTKESIEIDDDDKDDDDENQYEYLEHYKSKSKTNKEPKNKCKKNPKIFTVNYDNSYIEDSNFPEKIQNGNIKVIDRDNFVEDIIEDLKVYYNDAVIKDCYCSLSSLKNSSKRMLIFVATFVANIMYYISYNIFT